MRLIARWARQFGLARAVCTLLLIALVPLRITDPRPLEEARLRTFDLFQVLRPREQTARPVVIVDMDEKSQKEIGQWPWPRDRHADRHVRQDRIGARRPDLPTKKPSLPWQTSFHRVRTPKPNPVRAPKAGGPFAQS